MKIQDLQGRVFQAGFISEVPTGNLVWVDQVNGNDALAAVGRLTIPFKTLAAARDAAAPLASSDAPITIMVLPGVYYGHDLARPDVHWHFFNQTKVIGDSTATGEALFNVGEEVQLVVSGEGDFDAYDCDYVLKIDGSGADVAFSARRLAGGTSALQVSSASGGSRVHLRAEYVSSTAGSCIDVRAGVAMIDVHEIIAAVSNSYAAIYSQGGGELHVRAITIETFGTASSSAAVMVYGGLNLKVDIEAYEIRAVRNVIVVSRLDGYDGLIMIRNSRIVSGDNYAAVVIQDGFNASPPALRLWNCFVNSTGYAVYRASSGGYAGFYGKCVAKGTLYNVTAVGDFVGSSSLG
jgi:hypothetical protein